MEPFRVSISMLQCFFSFLFYEKSCFPSAVYENVAALFCCEAPEMFCGLRNFTRLPISLGLEEIMSESFWLNCSFNSGFETLDELETLGLNDSGQMSHAQHLLWLPALTFGSSGSTVGVDGNDRRQAANHMTE